MKLILKSTVFYYGIACCITGSIYRLIVNEDSSKWLRLIVENILYFLGALIISYLGYLTAKNANK